MLSRFVILVLLLLAGCRSAADLAPAASVSKLDTTSPSDWEKIAATYPPCALSADSADASPRVEIPRLRISLPLPPGAELSEGGEGPGETWVWRFAPDSAVLHLQRLAGIEGAADYTMILEDAGFESAADCSHRVDGHAAVVRRMRFPDAERTFYGATIQMIPATGESLGASVLAPGEERRDQLLSVLLHLRVHPL